MLPGTAQLKASVRPRRRNFPSAGAKYQRQLGQGRPARADAGARRCHRSEQAAVARRHERHRQCRYRSRARLPALLVTAVADRINRCPQSRHDHALRDPCHPDAGARHHDRQCRAALYAGQRFGEPGPDRLGADLLHRRRCHHDPADRVSGEPLRAQALVSGLGNRLHAGVDAVRHGADADSDRAVPRVAGRVRRGFGAAVAIGAFHHLSERTPGLRHGAVRYRRHDRTGTGPGARRLADRELQLAVRVLHQPADRHSRLDRHERVPAAFAATDGRKARLVRLRHPERGARLHCRSCSTAARSRIGSHPAKSSSRRSSRPRHFICSLRTSSRRKTRSSNRRCFATAISPPACCSSSSSA